MSKVEALRAALEHIDSADCELQRAMRLKSQPLHDKLFEVVDAIKAEIDRLEPPEEKEASPLAAVMDMIKDKKKERASQKDS